MKLIVNNISNCDIYISAGNEIKYIKVSESTAIDNLPEKFYLKIQAKNKLKSDDTKHILSAVKNAAANLVLTTVSVYEVEATEDVRIYVHSDVYEFDKLKGDLPFAYLYSFIETDATDHIHCIACNSVDEKDVIKLYKALALTAQAGNSFSLGAIGYIFQINEIKKLCSSNVIYETLKDKMLFNHN